MAAVDSTAAQGAGVRPELKERLAALHAELGKTSSVDPELRELLVALLTDITRLLAKPGTAEESHSVTERLDELAVQFEAEHPALGTAIRQVVDTLAKAGI
jgi:Domain of unknown function (DUF4404)